MASQTTNQPYKQANHQQAFHHNDAHGPTTNQPSNLTGQPHHQQTIQADSVTVTVSTQADTPDDQPAVQADGLTTSQKRAPRRPPTVQAHSSTVQEAPSSRAARRTSRPS